MRTARRGGRGARRLALRSSRGSVVLETAIGIPILVSVGAAMLWGIGVGLTALSLADTARDAARALARGEVADDVMVRAREQSPHATIEMTSDDSTVTVRVRQSVVLPLLRHEVQLDEHSVAAREDVW